MRRRQFLRLLGGVGLAVPRTARAQSQTMLRIGYLGSETAGLYQPRLRAFHEGLRELGFEEGRNVAVEYRWAEGHNDRLPALAAELVRREIAVLAAPGSVVAALAAKAATSTIPVVFVVGADPVEAGLVPSLSRPGGNVTGVTTLNTEVGPKRLELLKEIVTTGKTFALVVNPTNPKNAASAVQELREAAERMGLSLHVLNATGEADFEPLFAKLVELQASGLVITNDTLFIARAGQLAEPTLRHSMPAAHQAREFAAAGGLLSYGGSYAQSHHQAGVYVGRILKGEKPADLPVQQVTKVELTINLKTAKALGVAVPLSLIGRADELIE
jgi:putative tryptophan/tyrosine transport system substrate-binding protein